MHFDTATNYFFAMEEDASEPMLELTHNHDQTEPYDLGNGYAHVAFTVDDLEQTVAQLEEGGVEVALQPKTMIVEGHDYRIAFVVDPDGYRVELIERGTMKVGTSSGRLRRRATPGRRPPSSVIFSYAAPFSLCRVSSRSMPERRRRFSPRILRLACSVSCG